MGIDPNAWAILALAGAALFLSVYNGSENHSKLHFWLRIFGLGLMTAMLAIFRRTTSMDTPLGSMLLIQKFSA